VAVLWPDPVAELRIRTRDFISNEVIQGEPVPGERLDEAS
jgi:hypothetical protein